MLPARASEHIAAGDVWIATRVDGEIAGVVALAPGDAPDTLNLNKLFARSEGWIRFNQY
jgi:hypothetical protein